MDDFDVDQHIQERMEQEAMRDLSMHAQSRSNSVLGGKKGMGLIAILAGLFTGFMMFILIFVTVFIGPIGYIADKTLNIPKLGGATATGAKVACKAATILPFIDGEDCWWVDLLKASDDSGLTDAIRVSFDCMNASEEARKNGECDESAIGLAENDSPMPPGTSQYLYLYMAASAKTGVPWQLIAAVHGTKSNFGETNCSPDGTRGGSMKLNVREWADFGYDAGRVKIKGDKKDECWELDPATSSTAIDGAADPRDVADAIFAQARVLQKLGATQPEWKYTGGEAGSCLPGAEQDGRIFPYQGVGGSGSLSGGDLQLVDTNPTASNIAAAIRAEFEKANMPGDAALAAALVETTGLHPDSFNGTFFGLYQTRFTNSRGGGQVPYRLEVQKVEQMMAGKPAGRYPEIMKTYPPSHQIKDAVAWWDDYLSGTSITKDTTDDKALWNLAIRAQGVSAHLAGNPRYQFDQFKQFLADARSNNIPGDDSSAPATITLEGPYKGKPFVYNKDPMSRAVRAVYGSSKLHSDCYVAHVHGWYQAFKDMKITGGEGVGAAFGAGQILEALYHDVGSGLHAHVGGQSTLGNKQDPSRDWVKAEAGKRGLVVNSEDRTPERNAAVGGVSNSMHLTTRTDVWAVDFGPAGDKTKTFINDMAKLIGKVPGGGSARYSGPGAAAQYQAAKKKNGSTIGLILPGLTELDNANTWGLHLISGYRVDSYHEHDTGKAIDVSNGTLTPELAAYAENVRVRGSQGNSGIKGVIYNNRIAGYRGAGSWAWRSYSGGNTGNPTADHKDHVHVFME